MNGKLYAAYGSNMNRRDMARRCPAACIIGTGYLTDYRLTFRGHRAGMANIETAPHCQVPVVLWAITQECERALDRYEGYPRLYQKRIVSVGSGEHEQSAMVYVMAPCYEKMPALPKEPYFNIIKEGYQEQQLDMAPLIRALAEAKHELKP